MARISILRECCKIIDENCESDFECYRVGYHLSYDEGKIRFHRVTTSPTGETSEWGYIDTKSYGSVIHEWEATIEDYCNLAITIANFETEQLKYEYGEEIECIGFQPIH